jgi:hypothetical protein
MSLLQVLGVAGKAGVGLRRAPHGAATIFGRHGFKKGLEEGD